MLRQRRNSRVVAVYTTRLSRDAAKRALASLSVPIRTADLKDDLGFLGRLKPHILFSLQYPYHISARALRRFPGGCFNLHFSLLPRYGGCYPITWAILNGEKWTGVTLHAMSPRFDDGPIIAQACTRIAAHDTAESLYRKQVRVGSSLFQRVLPRLLAGSWRSRDQDMRHRLYYRKDSIDWERDSLIDWSASFGRVHDRVRAFTYARYQLPQTLLNGRAVTIGATIVKRGVPSRRRLSVMGLHGGPAHRGQRRVPAPDWPHRWHAGAPLSAQGGACSLGRGPRQRDLTPLTPSPALRHLPRHAADLGSRQIASKSMA